MVQCEIRTILPKALDLINRRVCQRWTDKAFWGELRVGLMKLAIRHHLWHAYNLPTDANLP
jgi:hypothetical protein